MVVLSKITTKTGDRGTTALGDRRRVPKDHTRVEAFGTVDELNAVIGLILAKDSDDLDGETARLLRSVQNDLLDLGADLSVPGGRRSARKAARAPLRITGDHVRPLDHAIERFNAALRPLRSFVLPGGSPTSAWMHLARTVCRRAERRVVALARRARVNPQAIVYLNRLSDLLFVLARRANDHGKGDTLWTPGGGDPGAG